MILSTDEETLIATIRRHNIRPDLVDVLLNDAKTLREEIEEFERIRGSTQGRCARLLLDGENSLAQQIGRLGQLAYLSVMPKTMLSIYQQQLNREVEAIRSERRGVANMDDSDTIPIYLE